MIWVDRLFGLLFWPLRTLPVIASLVAFSLLTAVLALAVFRYFSNQRAIRRAKDRVQAHLLEIRLFQEQPRVVLGAYGRLLLNVFRYLAYCAKPMAVMALPLLIIFVQLEKRLSYAPLRPGEQFLLTAKLRSAVQLGGVTLRLPRALTLTAPPVHVLRESEVDWRIKARAPGLFLVDIVGDGDAATKRITIGNQIVPLSPRRARAGIAQRLWDSAESPLPTDGPMESIEVHYKPRLMTVWNFNVPWVAAFVAMMIVEMLALRGIFHIEI